MKHTVKQKTKKYTKQAVFFSGQRRGLLVCVLAAFCFFTGFFSGDENWWYLAVMLAAVIAVSLVLAFLSFVLVVWNIKMPLKPFFPEACAGCRMHCGAVRRFYSPVCAYII